MSTPSARSALIARVADRRASGSRVHVAAVEPEVREADGDVRLAAAEGRAEHRRLEEALEPRRAQAQHDLAERDDSWRMPSTFPCAADTASMKRTAFCRDGVEAALRRRRLASTSAVPTPMATAPALIQSPALSLADAAGRHQLHLRQRAAHVLEEPRPERRRGKHLHDVGAGLPRVEDLGRREAARASPPRRSDAPSRSPRGRNTGPTTKRAPARMTWRAVSASRTVPGAEQELLRQRRRDLLDQPHGARHGHRDLEGAHAALHQRVDDGAHVIGLLQADDGDDAARLDVAGRRLVCETSATAPSSRRRRPARAR